MRKRSPWRPATRAVVAVTLTAAGLAALAVPAGATGSVDATNYGVTCTGQTGSMGFSPPLSSAVVTGTETITVSSNLTGCTAKVPTGGTAITISKGTVTGTLTAPLNGQSGFSVLTGSAGSIAPTGSLSVAWSTATGSPTLSSGPTVINVLSTGVGFSASGDNLFEGYVNLTIPGAVKGTVSGSFSANSVYSFDSSQTEDTVGQLITQSSISSLALNGGLAVLGVKPTLSVSPASSSTYYPLSAPTTVPYFAEAKYGSTNYDVSQLVDWSATNPGIATLQGTSFDCTNPTGGISNCENFQVGGVGSTTVTATLGTVSASTTTTGLANLAIVTPSPIPDAVVGKPYFWPITTTGGAAPYVPSIPSIPATLPDGFALQSSPMGIVGTPTSAGTYEFAVEVTAGDANPACDPVCNVAYTDFTVTVDPTAAPLSISTTSLPGGTVGSAYEQVVSPSGGAGDTPTPYSWTVTSGSLPDGLTLSSAGVISGAPASDATGTSTFTVKVKDASDQTATQSLSITVGPGLSDAPTPLPAGTVDVTYSQALATPTGGIGPYSFALESGTIPSGLTLNADGTITGTPTDVNVGPNAFTAVVSDSSDPTQYVSLPESITVDPGIPDTPSTTVATVTSPVLVGNGASFTASVSGSGGVPTGTVAFSLDGVPDWTHCTLSAGSCAFYVPDDPAGTYPVGTYPVVATYSGDSVFAGSSDTLSLTVNPPTPTTTTVTVDPATVSSDATVTYSATVTPETEMGTLDGSVDFFAGSTFLCGTFDSSGPYSCTATNAPVGTDTITADFSPQGLNYAASSGTTTLTVNPNPPSVTTASVNPTVSTRGTVTFSATVAPASGPGTPTGTVTFADSQEPLYPICTAPLGGGTGSCTGVDDYGGIETITASYSGDGSFAPSSGTTTLTSYVTTKSDIKCTGLSTASGNATISGCTVPGYSGLKTATALSSVLLSGGAVTFSTGTTSVLSVSSTSPGQGSCTSGETEHITTGIVASGTTDPGFPVKFKVCESGSGKFTIVPGQKLKM